jgi:lipoprotein signal peptidase
MNDRARRAGWLLLAAVIATLDLWSKARFLYPHHPPNYLLEPGQVPTSEPVFEGWLNFRTIWNPGGVWSAEIPGGLLLWGTALAIPAILIWIIAPARAPRWETAAKALILGGAIGNFWDRLHWDAVRDWIDVYFGNIEGWHWPTFNVADMALVGGIGVLLLLSFRPQPGKDADEAAA